MPVKQYLDFNNSVLLILYPHRFVIEKLEIKKGSELIMN